MKAQGNLTQEDAKLFFRAACCVIAADGKIRDSELATLSDAMTRLGFPHSPEQVRGLAITTCKDIRVKGLDAESKAIAIQLRRFCKTPLGTLLQQTLASLCAGGGGAAEAEQRIASRFQAVLVSTGAGQPPALQASNQSASVQSNPATVSRPSAIQPAALAMLSRLDWRWIVPLLLAFSLVVRMRMDSQPATNRGKAPQTKQTASAPDKPVVRETPTKSLPADSAPDKPVVRETPTKSLPADPSTLKSLAVAQAEQLVKRNQEELKLASLSSLTPEVAKVLAKYQGELLLNGLNNLSLEVAEALSQHVGGIHLCGMKSLSPDVARALTKKKGRIVLHLTTLSPELAGILALGETEDYCLNSLTTLSTEAAQALAKKKGGSIMLMGLTSLSDGAVMALVKYEKRGGQVLVEDKFRTVISKARWTPSKRQSADIRNAIWGDSLETVQETADEMLSPPPIIVHPPGVTQLTGSVRIDGEVFQIAYTFFHDKLVGVYLQAIFNNSSPKANRDAAWNPYSTHLKMKVLLRQKYGNPSAETVTDGKGFYGPAQLLEWSRSRPFGDTSTQHAWNTPRHTVNLSTVTFTGVRDCSVSYKGQIPEQTEYQAALKDKAARDAEVQSQRTQRTLDGL